MKHFYLRLLIALPLFLMMHQASNAQCPVTTSSTLTVSNDTTLPCGGTACATLKVLNATTTLSGTTTYSVSSIPYAPDPFTGGTALATLSDDIYSGVIPIPFNFCYFGTKYNSCVIGSNANVSFNTALAGAYDPWSLSGGLPGANSTATDNAIMFPLMDFLNTSGGGIWYNTYGTAPCRRWVVSYNNVAYFNCTSTHGTVQMTLYESTNVIDMYFQTKPICSSWNSGRAITGIENTGGAPYAGGSLYYTAPGENGTAWSATNEAWRFTPSGTPFWTYTWYSSISPMVAIGTGTTINVCPTTTHTYYVKAVATSNCDSVVLWDSVKVTTMPAAPPITGTFSMCMGSTATVADSVAHGTWSSSDPTIAVIDSTGTWTGVAAGTAIISYLVPTGCALTQIVTVNALYPITGTNVMCLGNSVTLNNAAPGGAWTISPAGVATINAATGVVSSVAPGTTFVTYTTPAGCVSTYPVTVNPPPSNITGANIVCQASTIALSDSTSGGSWISGSPGVATVSSGGIVTGVSAGVAVITYQLPTTCYKTFLVTVNPLPAVIGGPNRVCATFDITLSDGSSGGNFTSSNPGVATIDPATGLLHGVSAGTTTITYTLPTGCLITKVVTVYALPSAPLTSDLIYCQHSSFDGVYPPLTAAGAAGGALVWYTDSTTTTPISTPTPSNTPGVYTWFVSQIVNQCESPDRNRITVTVHAQAVRPYISEGKGFACQHDTLSMYYNYIPFPGEQFWWSLPPFDSFATGYDATQPAIVAFFDTSIGMNIVTLTTSDGYHPCDVVDSLPVIVHETPHADFYSNHDVCMGDTVTVALTYISNNVSDYTWDFGSDYTMISASSNHGGPYKMTWSDSGAHILQLNAFDGFGCPPHTVYDTVFVHPTPNARIAPPVAVSADGHICWGDSVLFAPEAYNNRNTYTWTPEHFFHQDNSYNIWGVVERPLYVVLTATDPFGCTAQDSILVGGQYCCSVVFPSAFTPNGDRKNDVFRPVTQGHHKIHTFRVVNRWGVQVFESNNINGEWDGTFNGEPQDMGVYYYYIKYDCDGRTIEEKGEVTLIR